MSELKNRIATKAAGGNAVAESKPKTMLQWVEAMKPQIAAALPSVITVERFSRMVMTAISTTPRLAECTPQSFMGAMMQAAQLGVEPNTALGMAYLIPYGNQCQFQLGYHGMLDLAYRSGEFKSIAAHEVYANDTFEYEYGLEPKLSHKPALKDRGEVIAYYAVYTLKNGGFGFEVMSREDVEAHRNQYSKAKNSPWNTDFNAMAKKTLIKKALKYAPVKTEFVRQITADETVKTEISADMLDEVAQPLEEVEVTVEDAAPEQQPEEEKKEK